MNLAGAISTHRVYVALFAAYITFFCRVYRESSDIMTDEEAAPIAKWTRSGEDLSKVLPSEPALTREMALGRRPRGSAARRALSEDEALAKYAQRAAAELGNESVDVRVVEGALQIAAAASDPEERGRQLAAVYGGLGELYSAHARYFQALHAMDLAIGAAEESGNKGLPVAMHIALGQIELRHHRYYAAGTRFDDALRYSDALPLDRLSALRSGRGWAALMHRAAGGTSHDGAEPEADFKAALGAGARTSSPSSGSGASGLWLPSHGSCEAEGDGLDSDRVLSLVGLGLVRQADAQRFLSCAARMLSSSEFDAQ